MDFNRFEEYLRLENFLIKQKKLKTNSIIVTLPGLGISYFLNHFFEKNKKIGFGQITETKDIVSDCNIVELESWVKSPKANIKIADNLLQNNFKKKTFIVVIPTPSIMSHSDFKNSYLSSHVYEYFFLGSYCDPGIIKHFAGELEVKINDIIAEKVFEKSGGIPVLIKFLLLNIEKIDMSSNKIVDDTVFIKSFFVLVQQISKTNKEILEKLDIIKNNKFRSSILDSYFKKHPLVETINIIVNNDLTFIEDDMHLYNSKLTKVEAVILNKFIECNGFLSKEDVANIKWGKGSYDEYSDQAVGKTLQRLGLKLKKYKIEVIFKHGYKISKL